MLLERFLLLILLLLLQPLLLIIGHYRKIYNGSCLLVGVQQVLMVLILLLLVRHVLLNELLVAGTGGVRREYELGGRNLLRAYPVGMLGDLLHDLGLLGVLLVVLIFVLRGWRLVEHRRVELVFVLGRIILSTIPPSCNVGPHAIKLIVETQRVGVGGLKHVLVYWIVLLYGLRPRPLLSCINYAQVVLNQHLLAHGGFVIVPLILNVNIVQVLADLRQYEVLTDVPLFLLIQDPFAKLIQRICPLPLILHHLFLIDHVGHLALDGELWALVKHATCHLPGVGQVAVLQVGSHGMPALLGWLGC